MPSFATANRIGMRPVAAMAQEATLKVYDLRGRLIATLFNEMTMGGVFNVNFTQSSLARGLYIAVLAVGNQTQFTKFSIQ